MDEGLNFAACVSRYTDRIDLMEMKSNVSHIAADSAELRGHIVDYWDQNQQKYDHLLLAEKIKRIGLKVFEDIPLPDPDLFSPATSADRVDLAPDAVQPDSADQALMFRSLTNIRVDLASFQPGSKLSFVDCSNLCLTCSQDQIDSLEVSFQRVNEVSLEHIDAAQNAFFNFEDCVSIRVTECSFRSSEGVPLTLLRCNTVLLSQLRFTGNRLCSIYIGCGCSNYVVQQCDFIGGQGKSNWHAPIVVSARTLTTITSSLEGLLPDGYWARAEKISEMSLPPTRGFLVENKISDSLSSGIYLDGAVNTVVESNSITGSSKEGICLDYGCLNVTLFFNQILHNGDRYNKSDDDLAKDFVLQYGRCEDGSAKAKLPGISIDNSGFCSVVANQICYNYGSGIKMVRAGIGNVIANNSLMSNNQGRNDSFHFFGIELGAASADVEAADIDFAGSSFNVLSCNNIVGAHYAGLFIPGMCDDNLICDNVILRSESFSIEATEFNPSNRFLNNFSQENTRNCSLSLLRPVYAGSGFPVFDVIPEASR